MTTNQISVVLTSAAAEITTCTRCDSPTCLALIRADTPPAGLFDFIDRQAKLIASGHWGWSTVGYCGALAGIALAVGLVAIVVFALVGPLAGGISGIATGTGLVGGGALLRWLRKRKTSKSVPQIMPPGSEPTRIDAGGSPVRAA